jgi:hypothetical protein
MNSGLNLAKVAKSLTSNAILGKRKHSGAEICSQTFARLLMTKEKNEHNPSWV